MRKNTAGERECLMHEINGIKLGAAVEEQALHTRMMHAFHRIRRVNVGAFLQLSQSEYFALQIIGTFQREHPDKEGIYVSVLAEKLWIASSQASRMLRNMERHGLILRTVDTKNRRNTYVSLTEEGNRLWRRTTERLRSYITHVMDTMGEEKLEEMLSLCNELADVMEAEVKKQMASWEEDDSEKREGNETRKCTE